MIKTEGMLNDVQQACRSVLWARTPPAEDHPNESTVDAADVVATGHAQAILVDPDLLQCSWSERIRHSCAMAIATEKCFDAVP